MIITMLGGGWSFWAVALLEANASVESKTKSGKQLDRKVG
jgi:hypothetical protein